MAAGHAGHSTGPLREHRRRFRIGGQAEAIQLRHALRALDEHGEALALAFGSLGLGPSAKSVGEVKAALRLLIEGERGQFR